MKTEIAYYISCCNVCNLVKAERQKPAGMLQPLEVPFWKWEEISMDFIVGLPKSSRGNDSIWVIVDRLTKVSHFIPVKTTYRTDQLAQLYLNRIVRLHGVPKLACLESLDIFISVYAHIEKIDHEKRPLSPSH